MARKKKDANVEQLPNHSGVYKIINTITGDFYIGSAVNINRRIKKHIYLLKLQKHHNQILQNSYNKHGEDKFIFEVLEKVEELDLLVVQEQKYIDILKPKYNIAKCVIAPMLGKTHSKEWRENHSKMLTGRKRPCQSENFKGERNPFYGKKHTKETIEKMKKKLIEQKKSAGENNASSKLTWDIVKNIRQDRDEGLSCVKLSKKYNISKSQILRIINNQSWKE